MQNDPDSLETLWPSLSERGAAALRPHLARRVIDRLQAAREELSPSTTLLVGLGTALACLTLTLALNFLNARRASEQAIEQWSAFTVDDDGTDQGT
jgi:hypothetical protein